MTDEQIIKALELCAHWENDKTCEDCPANTYDFSCANRMAKYALNFINRKKAENEQEIKEIESEAIKEFVARLCKGRVENDPIVIATKAELDYVLGVGLEVQE